MNSTKYANLFNPRREGDNYQIAPNGNYNYYPENLTKRANLNNSNLLPIHSNHESSLMMNNSHEFAATKNSLVPKQNKNKLETKYDPEFLQDDLILDIKLKHANQQNQKYISHSNNASYSNFNNKIELPHLSNPNNIDLETNEHANRSKSYLTLFSLFI